LKFRFKF